MSSINWLKPGRRENRLFFVKCPPNKLVYMLAKPDDFHVLVLHWVEEMNGSYPHLGEGRCRYCDRRTFEYTYAPCLVFGKEQGRWFQAILPIGDPTHTLATTDFSGSAIYVGRPKPPDDTKRMIYHGTPKELPAPVPHVAKAFDVRPYLLRRWGLFNEAELEGCERHEPQPTLEFPLTGTDK